MASTKDYSLIYEGRNLEKCSFAPGEGGGEGLRGKIVEIHLLASVRH